MSEQPQVADRRNSGHHINRLISIETTTYIDTPILIDALKDSAKESADLINEYASQAEARSRREQRLTKTLENQKLAAIRDVSERDKEIAVLHKELVATNERIRDLSRQATAAFTLSSLAAITIAIGVNVMTSNTHQGVGIAVTGIGFATQIATFFVIKRTRGLSGGAG